MTELTQKQKAVYDFIKKNVEPGLSGATITEIKANFNYASANSAFKHVEALIDKGFVERNKRGQFKIKK